MMSRLSQTKRRFFVWCQATSEVWIPGATRAQFCPWKGYRSKNPEKPCPRCGGNVSIFDREEKNRR